MSTENPAVETTSVSKTKGKFTPLLVWVLFAGIFFGISASRTPFVGDISSQQILDIFVKYARFAGAVLGLLSMVIMYILYIIRRILRLHKNSFSTPVILILSLLPWLIFGYQLVFREPRFTALARALISFFGEPMLYTSCALVGLSVLWLIVLPFKKHS